MTSSIILETDRLILRRWTSSDRLPFAHINSDPRVMQFMPAVLSSSESDYFMERIQRHFQEHGFGLYAAESRETGAFIGFIGFQVPTFEAQFTPCVEVGWRLDPQFWGKGLATEGGRAVVRHGFEVLGLKEIVSFTAAVNVRARRVIEKLGMKRNPEEDFDHPGLPPGHWLRRHVLYRLIRPAM